MFYFCSWFYKNEFAFLVEKSAQIEVFVINFVSGCTIYAIIATQSGIGSIVSMTVIAYDRYVMITSPMRAIYLGTKMRSVKLISFIWVYTSLFSLLPNLGLSDGYIQNGNSNTFPVTINKLAQFTKWGLYSSQIYASHYTVIGAEGWNSWKQILKALKLCCLI